MLRRLSRGVIRIGTLGVALLCLLLPTSSFAFGTRPTDEFGLGARDAALGMAYTAVADDFTAVYYNPAGLAFAAPGLSLDLGYKAYGRGFSAPEEDAQDFASLPVIGVVYNQEYAESSGWWRLPALGFAAMTLAPDLQRQLDDNNPHSIRYNSQALIPLYLGAAYRLTPRFSIGGALAVSFSGSFRAFAVTTGTPVMSEVEGLSIDGPVQFDVAPHFGIKLGPFKGWHLGLAYRSLQKVEVETSVNSRQELILGLPLPIELLPPTKLTTVAGWSPQQIAGGIAYSGLPGWLFSSDVVFKKWDEWVSSTGRRPDPGFRNRVVPRLGVEHQLTRYLALQGGYYFEPSPVPEQRGDTSYVDNDQHVFSVGLSYSLDRFLRLRTTISPAVQLHWLTDRATRKADPANAFFPGYEVGGTVISGGVIIRIQP